MQKKVEVTYKVYDPKIIDNEILKFWEENNIYKKVKEKNLNKQKFYFLDGPPYVTNPIHVGTAWNKIIKDSYLRYYRMKGYDVWDRAGYDMHGLPIEVQVEQILKFKSKKDIENYGIENFIKFCKEFALKNLFVQQEQFKNLCVWMDWENPYMTIKNEYIEGVWFFIKKAYEKNLLYKGEKVIHWCPRCETALAGYEVAEEYKDKEDYSLYVKFKLIDEDAFLLVWTTTPWTLPSNVAVAVHPSEIYVYGMVDEKEIVIFAKKRKEDIERETKKKIRIIKEIKGKEIEGKKYINPLEKYIDFQRKIDHIVITSEKYVSMFEGTGCVHIAPGHGKEDFELSKEFNLLVFSPVNNEGKYTEDVGKYNGKYVFEANEEIIEDLKRLDSVFFVGKIIHKYPHCWRCKTPLILRLSEQWFLDVPKIKNMLIEKAKNTIWYPSFAFHTRFLPWLEGAHEWAISRQRYWGIPMPIWICEKCNNITVIGSISELLSKAIQLPNEEIDLHRNWLDKVIIKCDKCGGRSKRILDVLDVWVDSGTASWSSLEYPSEKGKFERLFPADLIIEGPDQIRGWFYTLLVTSIVTFEEAPFKKVIMHGWSLDETGRAMHKSLGNVIYPEEVIQKFGRDTLRVYELLNTTWEDLKFSLTGLQEVYRNLNIIMNTYYFASLYINTDNFDPLQFKDFEYLNVEDKWLLTKLEYLKKIVTESFENGCNFIGLKELISFLVNDVSRWYIKIIRRRVWIEKEDPSKNAVYYTLFTVLSECLKLLAPYAPIISETLYQKFARNVFNVESVHLLEWPAYSEIDSEFIKEVETIKEIISEGYALRMKKGIKLRKPVKQVIVVPKNENLKKFINKYERLIKEQLNTKELKILTKDEIKELLVEYKVKLNYAKVGPIFKDLVKEISSLIEKISPKDILEKEEIDLETSKGKVKLNKDMLIISENLKENYDRLETKDFDIYIDFSTLPELEKETLAREIIRRIQIMRKMLDLEINERIKVYVKTIEHESKKILEEFKHYIMNETLAEEIKLEEETGYDLVKEWEIDDEIYTIGIKRMR